MSVSLVSNRTSTRRSGNTQEREVSEFDGLWINVGVNTKDEETGEENFVRLPRGIAVADLQTRKVYENMNEDFAADLNLTNSIIEMIREAGLQLEEGESKNINLSVQLYKRQEAVETAPVSKAANESLKAQLFGD